MAVVATMLRCYAGPRSSANAGVIDAPPDMIKSSNPPLLLAHSTQNAPVPAGDREG